MGIIGDFVGWCGDRIEDVGEWVDDNVGGPIGDFVGGSLKFSGKVVGGGGKIVGGIEDFTIGGAEKFVGDRLSDAWSWASGRSKLDHELYLNYEKVDTVTNELKTIATQKLGEAQDEIYEAFNKLNRVKGFQDYVGNVATQKYDQVFTSLTEAIMNISTSIERKAEAIKVYEESSPIDKAFGTITMVFAKQFEGVSSILESIGDGGIYLVGWAGGNVFGAKEFQKDCQKFIEKDVTHDLFDVYYNSDFAKASAFTEDSKIAGALKFSGTAVSMMAVGPVGRVYSGFGKGVEAGLKSGMSYNEAFGHGVKTAVVQGLLSNTVMQAAGPIGMGVASLAGDAMANTAKKKEEGLPFDQAEEIDEVEKQLINNTTNSNVTDPGEVQYRNNGYSGGGNNYVPPKATVDEVTKPDDLDINKDQKDDAIDIIVDKNKDNNDDNNNTNNNQSNDYNNGNNSNNNTGNNSYNIPVNQPNNGGSTVYYREDSHSGMEYNGGNGPMEEVVDEGLENSDALADLETMGFDTDLDEIVRGNKYTKVPISMNPIGASKKTGSNGVVPIAAGLTVASAAGLGAKAYMDYKRNNSEDDEDFESEDEDENEDIDSDDNIEIDESARDEELKENMSDYYQSDSVYTARENLEEV
ncbi:MAG: hypothetical protein IKF29_09585 [Oceanobacillus sp.]|nr:hypothetical protein [Oceanobacillus sp.]